MRIVVATDSFKECMSAVRACDLITATLLDAKAASEVRSFPLADGGEGTIEAFRAAKGGQWVDVSVTGPLPGTRVRAGLLWMAETQTALVEMARASGLEALEPEQRTPLKTTTYGTGELLAAARDLGARRVLLALGGSATVDLGVGCAAALGWRFLDREDRPVEPVGGGLLAIQKLLPPERPWDIPTQVLCDVSNPLLGVRGAAKVFGPQKGADRADVVLLEVGLTHLAHHIRASLNLDVTQAPGGGAAGGLAAGAAAFLGAELSSGSSFILEETGAAAALAEADWVITGEGRLDAQSLDGKVVSGVVSLCQERDIPVTVFAGRVDLNEAQLHEAGVHEAVAISPPDLSHELALAEGPKWLAAAALQWALSRRAEDDVA